MLLVGSSCLLDVDTRMGFAPPSLMEMVAQRLPREAVAKEVEDVLSGIRPPESPALRDRHRELGPGSLFDLAQGPLGLASAGAEETLT